MKVFAAIPTIMVLSLLASHAWAQGGQRGGMQGGAGAGGPEREAKLRACRDEAMRAHAPSKVQSQASAELRRQYVLNCMRR
jgi:hypothetical protein